MHLRWLLPAYLAVIAIGYLLLTAPDSMARGHELSPTAALFSAVNAVTLTGFPTLPNLAQYQLQGQLTVLGLVVFGSLFVLIIGGIAGCRALGISQSPARVTLAAVLLYATLTGAGVWGIMRQSSATLLEACVLACSALGNVGLYLNLPSTGDRLVHTVLLPLVFVGGLGVPVVLDLLGRLVRRRDRITSHTWAALSMGLGLYLLGIGLVLLYRWMLPAIDPPREALINASALSLNARTAGFPFVFADQFPRATQWAMMLLMAIGGASAGLAGGIKTTTLAAIAAGARNALLGRPVSRVLGVAVVWVAAYLGVVLLAMLTLLVTEPQIPADRMLFEVISAASNVGLSFGPVSLVGPGMYVLCLTMLLGRLLPLIILVQLARTTDEADHLVG